jgi:hypothetical protein
MFYMKDGEVETSIEWFDEVSGTWNECNVECPKGRTPSEHIYLMRKLAKDIGDDHTVQYRIVTTVYDIK